MPTARTRLASRLVLAAGLFVLAALVASATFLPAPLAAQTVEGVVRDSAQAQPVAGALISLLDASGAVSARGLTHADGGYVLTAPAAGVYRVRVERIGYRATTSSPLTLAAGDTLVRNLRASVAAVSLAGIEVSGKRRCVTRPAEGEAVATVWGEARKALETARRTSAQGLVRYDLRMYERRMDDSAHHVLNERSRVLHGTGTRPFASLPAAQLIHDGFVSVRDSGRIYYAPDPEVLLSNAFLDNYCFRLARPDRNDSTLIGLEFDPVRRRQVTDISGTFWIDRRTDRLKSLRFHYLDDLDLTMESDLLGGYESFEALPSGAWIIRRWWIRGPLAEVHELPGGGKRPELVGIHESGGEVTSLRVQGLGRIFRSREATLAGVVRDSLASASFPAPLAGALVRLRGTADTARTGATGQFTMSGIAPGAYDVGFSHPKLVRLGVTLPPKPVTLVAGDTAQVVLAIPSLTTLLAASCPDSARSGRRGVLVGVASDSLTGAGVPGVRIALSWPTGAEPGMTAGRTLMTSGAGGWRACGVPAGVPITITAAVLGRTRVAAASVPAGGVTRSDVTFPLSRPATVLGSVVDDASGEAVAGASVRLGDVAITTDAKGGFRAGNVPPGELHIVVEDASFGTLTDSVVVQGGSTVRLDIRLAAHAIPLKPITATVLSSRERALLARGTRVDRLTGPQLARLSEGAQNVEEVLQRAHMLGIEVTTTHMVGSPGQPTSGQSAVCIEDARRPTPPDQHDCHPVLVFVDGTQIDDPETDLFYLRPQDLAGIEYLPPMEAATYYGTEGGNGVLLITTKAGGSR